MGPTPNHAFERTLDPRGAMRLLITEAARTKLVEAMAAITEYHPVACVGWVSRGVRTKFDPDGSERSSPVPPHWGVGFYDPANLSSDQITTVSGIPFLRDERLDGKTLDFLDGRFDVR
jgi:hypothetical protein